MEHLYVIGIDYGTDSVRALLADAESGEGIAVAVCNYSRWGRGLYCDTAKSQFRQHPLDYLEGLEQVLRQVIAQCPAPEAIRAIAVDTTASTPCLVDRTCTPLSLTVGYEENPDAMFVLWKDHTAQRESEEITALCARGEINYARRSGNHYSSECFWSKVLHLLRGSERLRRDAWAVVELCDWIPAVLTGCRAMEDLRSGLCVAGSKVMWAEEWGGYPPEEFFAGLDPVLLPILRRLPVRTYGCDTPAGTLSPEWAAKLGLSEQVVIGVGNVDCHSGAVGAGICHGTVVLNLGTSACYMAVMPPEKMGDRMVEGIFGQVDGSILPGMVGFEAGMSAFGDVYAWLSERPPFALSLQPADRFGRGAEPLGDRTGALLRLCRGDGFRDEGHTRPSGGERRGDRTAGGHRRHFAEIPLCHAAARRCDGHGDRSLRQRALLRARRRGPCGRRRGTLSVGRCGAAGALSVRRPCLHARRREVRHIGAPL